MATDEKDVKQKWMPETKRKRNVWKETDKDPLWLLKKDEWCKVPGDVEVESILGKKKKCKDLDPSKDDDERFGVTAWGIRESNLAKT